MAALTDNEISQIIRNLITSSQQQSRNVRNIDEEFMSDYIDIDKFIEVLYSLLESNGYLIEGDKQEEENNTCSKFTFTQEFPNFLVNSNTVVSVEVEKRVPASLSANSEPFSGVKSYRPMYLGQEKDEVDGGINIDLQSIYDNEIKLVCWSDSLIMARNLSSLFESIMQKYYWVLRKYVPVLVYTGRQNTIVTDKYGDSRYFGIPLHYFVRTNERFILKESELKNINISHTVG